MIVYEPARCEFNKKPMVGMINAFLMDKWKSHSMDEIYQFIKAIDMPDKDKKMCWVNISNIRLIK